MHICFNTNEFYCNKSFGNTPFFWDFHSENIIHFVNNSSLVNKLLNHTESKVAGRYQHKHNILIKPRQKCSCQIENIKMPLGKRRVSYISTNTARAWSGLLKGASRNISTAYLIAVSEWLLSTPETSKTLEIRKSLQVN